MGHTKELSDLRFESLNLALQVDAVVSKERAAANNPQHSLLFFIIHAVHTWELERQRLCANRLASLDSKRFGILEGAQIRSVFSHRSIHSLRLVLPPVVRDASMSAGVRRGETAKFSPDTGSPILAPKQTLRRLGRQPRPLGSKLRVLLLWQTFPALAAESHP